MKKNILLILLLTSSNLCFAKPLSKNEINLKNFGFTYCLTKSSNQITQSEASLANGAYFQNGNYDENAYKNIKKFLDTKILSATLLYQDTETIAILPKCLDIYNSLDYQKILKKQKKFLIQP